MDKYELLKDIGSGNFGVARLMRNKDTKELVAMKYIPRGLKVCGAAPRFLSSRSIPFLCPPEFSALIYGLISLFSAEPQIDENVAREIINHRSLRHPNIIRFKEVSQSPNGGRISRADGDCFLHTSSSPAAAAVAGGGEFCFLSPY